MSMFTLQTLGLILAAGLIGVLIGWLLRSFFCRGQSTTGGRANLSGSTATGSVSTSASMSKTTAAAGVAGVAAATAAVAASSKAVSGSVSGAVDNVTANASGKIDAAMDATSGAASSAVSGAVDSAANATSNVTGAIAGGVAAVGAAGIAAANSNASSSVASRTTSGTSTSAAKTSSSGTFFSCNDIHSYYGESYIIQGVSFEVKEGEIIALLGRNGAGKTTTLRSIARADDPQLNAGEIWLDGKPLHNMKAHEAAQLGVCLVPEDRRIIPGLTVDENLQIAQIAEPVGWDIERIYDHFPRLRERKNQEGITLSGGEQQMLAVARALARDIKLLLLDEPYEGLAPVIVKEIEDILQDIKKLGITTILVEQNAVAALRLADRAIILDTGLIVFDGTAQEVLDNEQLRNDYLAI